jgi:hypothetical protein
MSKDYAIRGCIAAVVTQGGAGHLNGLWQWQDRLQVMF